MIQNTLFDYLYIDDLVKVLDYFIERKPKYRFYNIGQGNKVSLLSIAQKINSLDSCSMPIRIQKKGLNKEYTCNNKRFLNEMKDFRFTKIDVGIRELYNWYRKNWKNINTESIKADFLQQKEKF